VYCSRRHRALDSFPTRRSSDLSVRNAFASVIRDRALGAVVVVQQLAVRAMLGKRQVPRILRVVAKVPLVVIHLASPKLQEPANRSEEHTSELQSRENLVCRLLR